MRKVSLVLSDFKDFTIMASAIFDQGVTKHHQPLVVQHSNIKSPVLYAFYRTIHNNARRYLRDPCRTIQVLEEHIRLHLPMDSYPIMMGYLYTNSNP